MNPGWVSRGRGLYKPSPELAKAVPPTRPGQPHHGVNRPPQQTRIQRNYHAPAVHASSLNYPRIVQNIDFQPRLQTSGLTTHETPRTNGILIEFCNDGTRTLGLLVDTQDSGRTWTVLCKHNTYLVASRDMVTFEWPQHYLGQRYRYGPEDIERLEAITKSTVNSYKDHLKIAWGSYVDKDVSSISSQMLASFLFGSSPKPHEFFVSHCLLMEDDLYFDKMPSPNSSRSSDFVGQQYMFYCRPMAIVTQLQKERKERKQYQENLPRFLRRARAKLRHDDDEALDAFQMDNLAWDPKGAEEFLAESLQLWLISFSLPSFLTLMQFFRRQTFPGQDLAVRTFQRGYLRTSNIRRTAETTRCGS